MATSVETTNRPPYTRINKITNMATYVETTNRSPYTRINKITKVNLEQVHSRAVDDNNYTKTYLFTSNAVIELFAYYIPYQATADETGSSNLPGVRYTLCGSVEENATDLVPNSGTPIHLLPQQHHMLLRVLYPRNNANGRLS
eukprot:scaffold408_cov71-Cylindrotheca_fusiformis.AAC.10